MKSNLVSTYRQATTRQHCGTQVYFPKVRKLMQLISFTKHLLNQDFFVFITKLKKLLKVELSPGQSHKHKATYHINKRVDGAVLRTYDILRDVTKFQMYVVSGTPINDATDTTLVSTSTIAMDVVNRLSYKYIRDVVIRDSYVSTTALGPITTANIISDSSIKPDAKHNVKTITKLRIHMEQSIRRKRWYIGSSA